MVRQRLTNFEVAELDSVGQPTGATVISREFEILQDSGIRVDGRIDQQPALQAGGGAPPGG